jgi:hypothetical protein
MSAGAFLVHEKLLQRDEGANDIPGKRLASAGAVADSTRTGTGSHHLTRGRRGVSIADLVRQGVDAILDREIEPSAEELVRGVRSVNVFVDTLALYAILDGNDNRHAEAAATWAALLLEFCADHLWLGAAVLDLLEPERLAPHRRQLRHDCGQRRGEVRRGRRWYVEQFERYLDVSD